MNDNRIPPGVIPDALIVSWSDPFGRTGPYDLSPMRSVLCLLTLTLALQTPAADPPATRVSALALGDYYWVVENHNPTIEDRNGFWLRRIFLTVDQTLSESLTARLRFEANGPGDFTSSTILEPYLKDAWLKWRQSEALTLIVGMAPNPVFQSVEDFWGYRSLEKTPLDLQRFVNTRDVGVGIAGRVKSGLRYHVAVGNGANIGGETDSGKQLSVLVGTDRGPFLFEVSGEVNDRAAENRSTIQAMAGWRREGRRAGVLFAHQTRDVASGDDVDLDVASAFLVYPIRPRAIAIARVDRMFDPNPEGALIPYLPFDPTSASTLVIAGVDFKLHANFGVIPNLELVSYDEDVNSDLLARISFYYSF